MKATTFLLGSLVLLAGCAVAPPDSAGVKSGSGLLQSEGDQDQEPVRAKTEAELETESSVGHAILLYLPNRIFDILDIVRARVRVGPGWSLSARATELLDLNMGAHATVFVGLRGPRHEPRIPWPFGVETMEGLEFSVADSTDEDAPNGPNYGPLEVGLGIQLLVIGADLGVPLMEVVDLVAGLVFLDPMDDDY